MIQDMINSENGIFQSVEGIFDVYLKVKIEQIFLINKANLTWTLIREM